MPLSEYRGWEFSKAEYEKEIEKLSLHNQELAKTAKDTIETAVCENGDLIVIEFDTVYVGKVKDSDPYWSLHGRGPYFKSLYERVPRFIGKDELAGQMDKHYKILSDKLEEKSKECDNLRDNFGKDLKEFKAAHRAIDNRIWDELTPRQKQRIQGILHKGEKKFRKND